MLPLRDAVPFPRTLTRIAVGRLRSTRALLAALEGDRHVFLVAQRRADDDDPGPETLYDVGCIARISRVSEDGDAIEVELEVAARARAESFRGASRLDEPLVAQIREAPMPAGTCDPEVHARLEAVVERVLRGVDLPFRRARKLLAGATSAELADVILAHLRVSPAHQQRFLESDDLAAKIEVVLDPQNIPFVDGPAEDRALDLQARVLRWLRRL